MKGSSYYFLSILLIGVSKDGGFISILASWFGPGEDKSKYNLESSVTPKSLLEPVSLTLFKASLNRALWASSLLSKKVYSFSYIFIFYLSI